jgi:hypothetical protein
MNSLIDRSKHIYAHGETPGVTTLPPDPNYIQSHPPETKKMPGLILP